MKTSNGTENEKEHEIQEGLIQKEPKKLGDKYMLPIAIVVAGVMVAWATVYNTGNGSLQMPIAKNATSQSAKQISADEEAVLPSGGVELPVIWGDLGSKLVSVGAIDADKFRALYDQRGAFTDEYKNLLFGKTDGKLKITNENAGYLLNLLSARRIPRSLLRG